MHARFLSMGWLLTAATLAFPSAAQPSAGGGAPPAWRSAFDGYQPYAEPALTPWRESNDTVGRIGGWRVYAREAQEAQRVLPSGTAPASPPAVPASPAAPAAGHRH